MSGGHVLVIEDDEWVARLLAVGLREAGHRVTLCAGGANGIAAIQQEVPDCVVCDVELGDDDGYAIGRSMRQAGGRIAGTPLVYLCAGDEDADTKVEALRNGGDAFLSKPFRIDEVALTVTALIRLAERNRALVVDAGGRVSPAPPAPSSRPPPAGPPDGVLEGDLAKVSVATVLTVLEMEKHTGDLEMSNAGHVARLHIGSGNVDGAQLGDTAAEPIVVLRTVLTWTGGRFIFVPTRKPERKMTGRATIGALLMEAARLEDEFRAGLPGREERRSSLPPRSTRGDSSWSFDTSRGSDSNRMSDSGRLSDALNLAFPSVAPAAPSVPAPPPTAVASTPPPAEASASGPASTPAPASAPSPSVPPASVPTPTPPASAVASPIPAAPRRPVTGPAPTAVPRPPLKRPVSGVVAVVPPATPSPSPVALRPPPSAGGPSSIGAPASTGAPSSTGTVTLQEAGRAPRPALSSGTVDDGWGSDEDDVAPVSLSSAEIVEPVRRGPPPVPPPRPTTSPTGVDVKAAQQRLAAQQAGASTPPPPDALAPPAADAVPGQVGDKR